MLTRKKFITGTITAAASVLVPSDVLSIFSGRKLKNFGFISGLIGKELQGDWKAMLRQAASLGYTEIETANYFGESAESYLAFLKEIGLKPVLGGIDFKASDEDLLKSLHLLKSLEMKMAVTYWPWYTGGPFTLDDCRKSADRLNYMGKFCHDNGVLFCWHNHNKEFIPMEEGLPFDYLMNNTDSNLVKCELDTYWVTLGGADPISVLRKYRGRIVVMHIQDMAQGDAKDIECPGSGIIDFPSIFREAELQGIDHYMVERYNGPDGLGCLISAAGYLKRITF